MMRLIDADALKENAYDSGNWKNAEVGFHQMVVDVEEIDEAPTVDAVPVVRCRDCVHWGVGKCNSFGGFAKCALEGAWHGEEFYCANGERKPEDKEGAEALQR